MRHSSSSGRGNSDTGAYCVCDTSGSVDGFNGSCVPPVPLCNCRAKPCFFDSPHGHMQCRRHSATLMYSAINTKPNSVRKIPPMINPISIASSVSMYSLGFWFRISSVCSKSSLALTIKTIPDQGKANLQNKRRFVVKWSVSINIGSQSTYAVRFHSFRLFAHKWIIYLQHTLFIDNLPNEIDRIPSVRRIHCTYGFRKTCNGDAAVVWLNKLPGRGS